MSVYCRQCGFENADGAVFCASCQSTVVDEETLYEDLEPLPDDLEEQVREALEGKVRILHEVGRGGMAVVYLGLELQLNRKVAVKCLPLENTVDKALVQRFHMEAKVAASLNHPHIVPIYAVGTKDRIHFFTMAFLEGGSLEDRIAQGLSLEQTVEIICQIASALDYAHGKNLVHRDIKPSNVMFDENGTVRVLDFGVARILHEARLTITRAILGTPEYMSPEQALSKDLDGRADLYALGTMFYQMVTGRLPFTAEEPLSVIYQHVNQKPVPPHRLKHDVPLPVSRIILKMMQKDPDKRFATGQDVVDALKAPDIAGSLQPRAARKGPSTVHFLSSMAELHWFRAGPLKRLMLGLVPLLCLLVVLFWPSSHKDVAAKPLLDDAPPLISTVEAPVPIPETPEEEEPALQADEEGPGLGTEPDPAVQPEGEVPAVDKPTIQTVKPGPKQNKPAAKPKAKPKLDPLPTMLARFALIDVFPESFKMGGFRSGRDAPAHKVSLSPFRMSATEVTQDLWQEVMKANPSCNKGPSLPVENVSWNEVQTFIGKLNQRTGKRFRLPTEAEWEYVAKTGRSGPYGVLSLDSQGWYSKQVDTSQPVRGKDPNGLGFFDIQGNVWEWCWDYYDPDYYDQSPERDPKGPESGAERVKRGGSFAAKSADCKVQRRSSSPPESKDCTVGFRLAI